MVIVVSGCTGDYMELPDDHKLTLDTRNSLLYWYPKLRSMKGIRTPPTIAVPVDLALCHVYGGLEEEGISHLAHLFPTFDKAIAKLGGYPIFMRTDYMAAKHQWTKTCYVASKEALGECLYNLLLTSMGAGMIGLPCNAIVFRKYIPMKTLFTAFSAMPVNPEYRFFIRDGKFVCRHWYWLWDSLNTPRNQRRPDFQSWERLMAQSYMETQDAIPILTEIAKRVAEAFPDPEGWSIDFCQGEDGAWWLIDMALAPVSYHHEHD